MSVGLKYCVSGGRGAGRQGARESSSESYGARESSSESYRARESSSESSVAPYEI